jgi:hypothetical protein
MTFKVFIAESNDPEDFYFGQLDGFAANEVLKVRRIRTRYRVVFNREMLRKAIAEATKWEADIFHLSCHGGEEGIQLCDQRTSGDVLSWEEVAADFQPFATQNKVLVNSSCMGGHRGVAEAFRKAKSRFGYICGSTSEAVTFHDSCVAWSILYNVPSNDGTTGSRTFRTAIDKINSVVSGNFVYRRWDKDIKRYRTHPSPPKNTR